MDAKLGMTIVRKRILIQFPLTQHVIKLLFSRRTFMHKEKTPLLTSAAWQISVIELEKMHTFDRSSNPHSGIHVCQQNAVVPLCWLSMRNRDLSHELYLFFRMLSNNCYPKFR